MKDIMFLFGSGADTDVNKKLESGSKFAESIIQNKYADKINNITQEDFRNFKLISHNSKKIFIQTIVHNEKLAREMLSSEDDVNLVMDYNNGAENSDTTKKKITEMCRNWYDLITNTEIPQEQSEEDSKNFFLENAALFGSLDEKFNSLRYPNKKDANAKRVINAYWTVFMVMFESLFGEISELDFDAVLKKLSDEKTVAESMLSGQSNCYYNTVSKVKGNYHIATTNYTALVSTAFENRANYLNGKLSWFEDLYNLTVYDCTQESERDLIVKHPKNIIPFIFIPSGVKPIVCPKQVKEYTDFKSNLESSSILCVIGYRFNSEDNHINSFIADWLRKDKNVLIYFNYKENTEHKEDFNLEDLYWIKMLIEGGKYKTIDKIKDFNFDVIDEHKVIDIKINKKNARETVSHFVEKYNQRIAAM